MFKDNAQFLLRQSAAKIALTDQNKKRA